MSRSAATFVVAMLLAVRSVYAGQTVEAFEQLALRVNLGDQVDVLDRSATVHAGRITQLTGAELTVQTDAGAKHFTSDSIRSVAVRYHPMLRAALIGVVAFAVAGAVAICSHRGGSDCALVGAVGAAPVGGGAGLTIGALTTRMRSVYVATARPSAAATHVATVPSVSLLEDLALRVNLDDQLSVEDQSGIVKTGRLTDLRADDITLQTAAGPEHFTRSELRRVALRHERLRAGTMIGAGTGALYGVASECFGETKNECFDAVIIGTALGAAGGLFVGALLHTTTVVYGDQHTHTFLSPRLSKDTVSLAITRSW